MILSALSVSDQINRLLDLFSADETQRQESHDYYEAGYRPLAIGLAVPPAMRPLLAKMGWPRIYIDSLEERLDIEGFRMGGASQADDQLWQWWQGNGMDVQSGLAHTEAMIHGRAYVTIAAPDPNDPLSDKSSPRLRVESPRSMYADVDPATDRVRSAIRVYQEDMSRKVTIYLPNSTVGYTQVAGEWSQAWRVDHGLGAPPVVVIRNRTRLDQVDGSSEIRPELRSITDSAARLLMNLAATSELMAVPQRMLFGIAEEELMAQTDGSSWDAYIARILAFADPDGKVTQLAAAELRNFADGMAILRTEAAACTGLPPQYFSFNTDNPASADAIRASESRLVKKSERKQRIFGEAWEQVMRMALLVMKRPVTPEAYRMEAMWRNAATPTYAAMADGVVKLATAVTGDGRPVIPIERARIDLGYSVAERDQMDQWDKNSPRSRLADLYGPPSPPAFSDNEESSP